MKFVDLPDSNRVIFSSELFPSIQIKCGGCFPLGVAIYPQYVFVVELFIAKIYFGCQSNPAFFRTHLIYDYNLPRHTVIPLELSYRSPTGENVSQLRIQTTCSTILEKIYCV